MSSHNFFNNQGAVWNTIQEALNIAACLISHAQCVFALMERDPAIDSAENLLAWAIDGYPPKALHPDMLIVRLMISEDHK